jgi:hypothetical protein
MSQSLLHAFRHPFILLSIAVLLFNDHLLKVLTPSWATGKISDFAGLFFFPFLIGFLFQACNPKSIPSHQALLVGFFLTAAVFAGLKTLPVANEWAAILLSTLYRQPIRIAFDPTDCIALIMFLPGWMMWRKIEGHQGKKDLGKMPYLVLAVGSLASLATSPCAPVPQVTRLAFGGGTLYAGIGFTDRFEDGGTIMASQNGWEDWHVVMYNQYNGTTWKTDPKYTGLLADNPFREPRKLPLTACDPVEPTTCYRIDGTPQVEESLDGGASWTTAWLSPADREDFRIRMAGGVLLDCGKIPDVRTFDLVMYPGPKGSTLLVAMGNEGLLVHPSQGGWQAVGITSAPGDAIGVRIIPTPFMARNLSEAIENTAVEFLFAVTAALLTWSIVSIWMRRKILHRIDPHLKSKRVFLPAAIALGLTLVIPAAIIYLTPRNSILLLSVFAIPFWIILAALAVVHFSTFPKIIPAHMRKVDWYVLLFGILVFMAGWLPMGLWAYRVIELYTPALILSIGGGLVILFVGIFWLNRRINANSGWAVQKVL